MSAGQSAIAPRLGDDPQCVVGRRHVRTDSARLEQVLEGAVQQTPAEQLGPQIEMRLGVVRPQDHRALPVSQRFLYVAVAVQG